MTPISDQIRSKKHTECKSDALPLHQCTAVVERDMPTYIPCIAVIEIYLHRNIPTFL
jgi:hypothetical protein